MNIGKLSETALLAEAAYGDLERVTTAGQLKTALIASGFSETQAAMFVRRWRVVAHRPNTGSGLSATLFERLDAGGAGSGVFTLAVRGTEKLPSFAGALDWATNIGGIGADGIAAAQALDLFHFYRTLTASAGEGVARYRYLPAAVDGGTGKLLADAAIEVAGTVVAGRGATSSTGGGGGRLRREGRKARRGRELFSRRGVWGEEA